MSGETWHEDDEFWKSMKERLFHNESVDRRKDEVDKIVSLLDLDPGSKILDLCCGIGRHSNRLADRGYEVMGVDSTESYLGSARDKAEEMDVEADYVKGDRERVQVS